LVPFGRGSGIGSPMGLGRGWLLRKSDLLDADSLFRFASGSIWPLVVQCRFGQRWPRSGQPVVGCGRPWSFGRGADVQIFWSGGLCAVGASKCPELAMRAVGGRVAAMSCAQSSSRFFFFFLGGREPLLRPACLKFWCETCVVGNEFADCWGGGSFAIRQLLHAYRYRVAARGELVSPSTSKNKKNA
jgi:hypothetical protein